MDVLLRDIRHRLLFFRPRPLDVVVLLRRRPLCRRPRQHRHDDASAKEHQDVVAFSEQPRIVASSSSEPSAHPPRAETPVILCAPRVANIIAPHFPNSCTNRYELLQEERLLISITELVDILCTLNIISCKPYSILAPSRAPLPFPVKDVHVEAEVNGTAIRVALVPAKY